MSRCSRIMQRCDEDEIRHDLRPAVCGSAAILGLSGFARLRLLEIKSCQHRMVDKELMTEVSVRERERERGRAGIVDGGCVSLYVLLREMLPQRSPPYLVVMRGSAQIEWLSELQGLHRYHTFAV
jgi:hypothetical protein